ncbi:MAG TPA: hypothetical protein VFN00_08920 [Arthrobacter sp.]|nr:hypothetical protein [Arthrobacter sp.]
MTKSDPGTPDPDPGANQDDAVWLDLVARLEETESGLAPEPAPGTAAPQPPAARTFRDFDPLGLAAPGPAPAGPAGPQGAADGPRDYEAGDDEGAFVPEEPPRLSEADPLTVLAWLGAVGGPIALMLSVMFWRSAPLLAIVGMVAAFAVSVVFLITKLPHEKDEYDDGARV